MDTWADDEDIVIGVVGVTGSGKSSLIKRLTASDDVVVGHGVDSETQEINQYAVHHNGQRFVVVDSPGFQDTNRDDEDIFHQLASWMESSYRAGQKMNGLIYLHPIIQPRQKGSEIRNLWMFKKLCGAENFGNVILGLTFCDQEHETVIAKRKQELIDTPEWWGDMVDKGSKVREISLERAECLRLLEHFAPRKKLTLRFQEEVVEKGMSISQTDAAQTILHKAELDSIREKEKQDHAKIASNYKKRMELAAADYHARTLRDRLRADIMQSRQSTQQQAMLLQIEMQEQVERRDKLRLWSVRIEEEAEEQRVQELSKTLEKTRLENEALTKRLKEREQIKNMMPLWRKRRDKITVDFNAISTWRQKGHISQDYQKWVYTDRAADDPTRGDVLEDLLTPYCDMCLKSFHPEETYHLCLLCMNAVCSLYPKQGFEGSSLAICQKCTRPGKSCFNSSHTESVMRTAPSLSTVNKCPRYTTVTPGLYCDICSASMSNHTLFFHCCSCDENFDMCISCWGKGSTCHDKAHDLNLIGQCPKDLADQV